MDRHRRTSSSGNQWSNEEVSRKMKALQESMAKLKLHHQRLAESLSNLEKVDRAERYMVSTFRRPAPRMHGRRLEFSPVGIKEADVPMFSLAPTIPIYSSYDGCSTH